MAVHVTDTVSLDEKIPFDPHPSSLDARWRVAEARQFLSAARDFSQVTSFNEFFNSHKRLFEQSQSRLQAVLNEHAHLEWFEQFFGSRPLAGFTVAIGLLNGGGCYGPRLQLPDGSEELYCILGAWSTDSRGEPQFDASMLSTVVHEFCHSYANAIIDRHASKLQSSGEKIFPHVAAAMKRQAYGNWKTMMYESLVRACTVRYTQTFQGQTAATRQIQAEQQRQFLWIKELSELLGKYEKSREQYKTLDDFAPQIVQFFDRYADSMAKKMGALKTNQPRVVSSVPSHGSANIGPSLAYITVTFDRPMQDQSWSLVGGGPNFPEIIGKPRYDTTKKIWSVPVRLKPNWAYRCMLNSGRFTSFKAADGTPLAPVELNFQTGPAR